MTETKTTAGLQAMRTVLVISTGVVLALLLVPSTTLSVLPQRSSAIAAFTGWLDGLAPGVDLDHLVAFALLGFFARFAQVRRRAVWAVSLLALLGFGCEVIQLWVPGREFWLSDAGLNVAGAVLGFGAASVVAGLRGSQGLGALGPRLRGGDGDSPREGYNASRERPHPCPPPEGEGVKRAGGSAAGLEGPGASGSGRPRPTP